jgi:hypothetical protein
LPGGIGFPGDSATIPSRSLVTNDEIMNCFVKCNDNAVKKENLGQFGAVRKPKCNWKVIHCRNERIHLQMVNSDQCEYEREDLRSNDFTKENAFSAIFVITKSAPKYRNRE